MSPDTDHARIFHSLPQPVLVIDRDHRVHEVNDAFCQTYKLARDHAVGRFCHEVTHGYSVPCSELGTECPLLVAAESRKPCRLIHRHLGFDGATRWEEVVAAPLVGPSGAVEYVVEELRDVTELLRTREVIEEMKKQMRILQGLVPMCLNCHRVRESDGSWHALDQYIAKHTEAGISHGLCPDCVKKVYPDV